MPCTSLLTALAFVLSLSYDSFEFLDADEVYSAVLPSIIGIAS